MTNDKGSLKKMHDNNGLEKINNIKRKINTTKRNIEVSDEIISETPYDAQRDKLKEKNVQRHHAIGSMNKEIRDIKQKMKDSDQEVSR